MPPATLLPPPDRRRLRRSDALLALACLGVVAAAWQTGRSARRVLAEPAVVRCAVPEDALAVWRRSEVHGRVLLHFARSIAMAVEPGPPAPGNYLARAIDEGLVRRVYHVIPDEAWAEVRTTLAARPGVVRDGEGFELQKAGAPIIVVPRAALPRVDEPALVTIEGERWSPRALEEIAAALRGPIRHDLVTWYAGSPERVAVLEGLARVAP